MSKDVIYSKKNEPKFTSYIALSGDLWYIIFHGIILNPRYGTPPAILACDQSLNLYLGHTVELSKEHHHHSPLLQRPSALQELQELNC